jgi:hypothetical protein
MVAKPILWVSLYATRVHFLLKRCLSVRVMPLAGERASESAVPQTLQMLLLNERSRPRQTSSPFLLNDALAQKRLCALLKYWLFSTHINELSNIWDKLEHGERELLRMNSFLFPVRTTRDQIFVCRCRKEARGWKFWSAQWINFCACRQQRCVCAKIFLSGCHNIELLRGSWQTVRGTKMLLCGGNFTHRLSIKSWT